MKKLMAALTITTLLLTGCGGSGTTINQLDPTGFSNKIQESGVTVLDVRRPDEFAGQHLARAVNINYESGTFSQDIQSLDKSKTYAVYCRSGNRSGQATALMAKDGFTSIYNLDGGIINWTAVGQVLVTN